MNQVNKSYLASAPSIQSVVKHYWACLIRVLPFKECLGLVMNLDGQYVVENVLQKQRQRVTLSSRAPAPLGRRSHSGITSPGETGALRWVWEERKTIHSNACSGTQEERKLHAGVEVTRPSQDHTHVGFHPASVHCPLTLQAPSLRRGGTNSASFRSSRERWVQLGKEMPSAAQEACLLRQSSSAFVHKCYQIARQLRRTDSMNERKKKELQRRYRSFNEKKLEKKYP